MMKYQNNIKNNVLFLRHRFLAKLFFMVLTSFLVRAQVIFAVELGKILEVQGSVFFVHEGKVDLLKNAMIISDFDEIMVEDRGEVIFVDPIGRKTTLAGNTNVKFYNRVLELRQGHLWIDAQNNLLNEEDGKVPPSLERFKKLMVQTANGSVDIDLSSAVINFNSKTGRTQALSIKGTLSLQNVNFPEKVEKIQTGYFSFIENTILEGVPRDATEIGHGSFMKLMAIFSEGKNSNLKIQEDIKGHPLNKRAGKIILIQGPSEAEIKIKEEWASMLKKDLDKVKNDLAKKQEKKKIPPSSLKGEKLEEIQINTH
jgi:hypothetical protein